MKKTGIKRGMCYNAFVGGENMSKDDRKRYLILKEPNILKGLIILAVPIMINNLIKTLHDIVDMFFVSRIPAFGNEAMASISVTFPVFFVFLALGIGLSVAGTSIISQYIGASQLKDARKYASNLVVISVLIGVLLNIIVFFSAETIMNLMGPKGYILENSVTYLRIRSFELSALFAFFAYQAIRNASGDTVSPVVIGVITVVLNIILSPILIAGLDLGVAGAAYATLISYIVIVPVVFTKLFRSKSGVTITLHYLKLRFIIVYDLIKTALPASLGQSITAVGFIVMQMFIISYGDDTITAFAVSNRLSSIILHPAMAIGGVLSAYIGQNIGNLNPPRAKAAFKQANYLAIGLMTFGSIVFIFIRRDLAGIFIDEGTYALELANNYLFYLLIGLPLMAIFQNFIGVFNGTGYTKFTFVFGVTRLWLLRIPLIFMFKNLTDFGPSGIWYAMLISNFVIALVGIVLYQFIDFKPKIRLE